MPSFIQLISSNGHCPAFFKVDHDVGRGQIRKSSTSPKLLLLLFRKHLQGANYQSRLSLYSRLRGTSVEDMKSPKEDYEIRRLVVSDTGTGGDLLNFLSSYTLVFIMYLYVEAINVLLKWSFSYKTKILNFFNLF